jgi:hypothetical protein
MKRNILALFVFAASVATVPVLSAQSLPAGSPTDVQVVHLDHIAGCEGNLFYIFNSICQPRVEVAVASADPNVFGFAVLLVYTDSTGVPHSTMQLTNTRQTPTSPYFTATFGGNGAAGITITTVIASPLVIGPGGPVANTSVK